MSGHVKLDFFERNKHELFFTFSYNGKEFPMSYRYDESVDFSKLEERYDHEFMKTIYFHIAAFEGNKLASLKPHTLDWGCFSHLVTEEFESLWRKVFHNVWAQWRYENDEPYYEGPSFISTASKQSKSLPTTISSYQTDVLLFCSSGKDSLACLTLLERGGIDYDTITYSSSIYGEHDQQHIQADRIIDTTKPKHRRKQWVDDSFMTSDILNHPDVKSKTLTAAETPSSIFGSLPIVLSNNYRYIALGHERSANTGQVFWNKTSEDVNHQWGKSFEAEMLINKYVQKNLITNFVYFSLLQPVYDALIFNILYENSSKIVESNSCNEDVCGCEKCPKCAYVYLGFRAYLPKDDVDSKYRSNLFNNPQNLLAYRQLLGLEDQLPFECIGQKDEVRLAFALCDKMGYEGLAIDMYKSAVRDSLIPPLDLKMIEDKYLSVHSDHGIPSEIAERVVPQMQAVADSTIDFVRRTLQ